MPAGKAYEIFGTARKLWEGYVLLLQDSTLTSPRFPLLWNSEFHHLIHFGSPSNQSNSRPSHRDIFFFINVNLLVVPRVDQAVALMHFVFDRLFLGVTIFLQSWNSVIAPPRRRETKKSIDMVYWSTSFGCQEFPLPLIRKGLANKFARFTGVRLAPAVGSTLCLGWGRHK